MLSQSSPATGVKEKFDLTRMYESTSSMTAVGLQIMAIVPGSASSAGTRGFESYTHW